MNYRNTGNFQSPGVGPLKPMERPKVILLFLTIPLAVSLLLGWFLLGGDWIYKKFKYDKHSSAEVAFDTVETATTANDLLILFAKELREFDSRSKEIFGPEHEWLEGNKRAETPESIYRYVQEYEKPKFLERYFNLSVQRLELEQLLFDLETKVDSTVTKLGKNATMEKRFQAERLIIKDVSRAIDTMKLRKNALERLNEEFTDRE